MISVCMATYNGERFLREQIDSILCQLAPDDELIISDDGSTDGTLDIIQSYNDKRIRLLHHKKKSEYAKIKYSRNFYYATDNFENALQAAQGDYIFLADQDDVWMKDKVEKCISVLKNVDFVVHQMALISNENSLLEKNKFYKNKLPQLWTYNIIHEKIWGCCTCFDRKVLDFVLPFPKKLIGHDYWISSISLKKFKCELLEDELIKYRIHDGSVSQKKNKNPILFKINFRIVLLFQLLNRLFMDN